MNILLTIIDVLAFTYTLLLLIGAMIGWASIARQLGRTSTKKDVKECVSTIGLGAILAMPFFGLLFYWGWL